MPTIEAKDFRKLLTRALVACCRDEARVNLAQIRVTEGRAEATDGHRLTIIEDEHFSLDWPENLHERRVSRYGIEAAIALMKGARYAHVDWMDGVIRVPDRGAVSLQESSQTFPPFDRIFPMAPITMTRVAPLRELRDEWKALSIEAEHLGGACFTPLQDGEGGATCAHALTAYLLDALKASGLGAKDEVRVTTHGEREPITIEPAEEMHTLGGADPTGYYGLVMPFMPRVEARHWCQGMTPVS